MKGKGDWIISTPFLLVITLALILQADHILILAEGSIPSTNDQNYHVETKLSQVSLATFIGEAEHDLSGRSLSRAGDVNGDGLDDILIGASVNDEGGENAGQAYLILGRTTGWKRDTDLSLSDASFLGETEGDLLGKSVSGVGDINGDGYDDILIAAEAHDEEWPDWIHGYLFFGRSTGWRADMNMSLANASFTDCSDNAISGAGDVNGDGYDDILIGSERYESYLVQGRSTGWSKNMDLSSLNGSIPLPSGESVSGGGDVNGDGYDDILLGSDGYNDDRRYNVGRTLLILGRGNGWNKDMDLSPDASFIGEANRDYSGSSVSIAGDVNGDGYDDILIGARLNDEEKGSAGQTYLILGRANGWRLGMDLSLSDASFLGEHSGDWSGYPVSGAGDLNSDGYDDLIIGARFNDEGGYRAGQTYIILGRVSGWIMDMRLACADVSFIGEAASDHSGYDISGAGDVNGDGFDDILIGAGYNDEGGLEAGQTYLISGYGFPEPREWNDPDRDGWDDNRDLFPNDPTEWNDTDNDGWGDNQDVFIKNPAEWKDTDHDGWGDNRDVFPEDPFDWNDTDRDGWGDNRDAFPENPSEWNDTDNDGTGDNTDDFPLDISASIDSDNDGYPDQWNVGQSRKNSTLGLELDQFPNDSGNWTLHKENDGKIYIVFVILYMGLILLFFLLLRRKGEIKTKTMVISVLLLFTLPIIAILLKETGNHNSVDEIPINQKEVEIIKFEEIGHFNLENIREIEVTDEYSWISCFDWDSDDNGLYRYDPDTDEMLYFNESNGLLSNWINCIEVDDEIVWVGTYGGISLYDQIEGTWSNFTLETGLGEAEHGYYWVDDIIADDDFVWVATSGNWQYTMGIRPFGGISCYNKMTGTWTAFGSKNGYLIDDYVQSIEKEGDNIYLMTLSGIYIFNTSEEQLYFWDDWTMSWIEKTDKDNYHSVYGSFYNLRPEIMSVNKDDIVLWQLNNDNVAFRSISLNIGTILTQEDWIADIEMEDDRIYLGTKYGVKIYNKTTEEWMFINKTHGLLSNSVRDIELFDDQLWIASEEGLNIFQISFEVVIKSK